MIKVSKRHFIAQLREKPDEISSGFAYFNCKQVKQLLPRQICCILPKVYAAAHSLPADNFRSAF
jgi:hypothetical protein